MIILVPLIRLLMAFIDLYTYVVFAAVIVSWLMAAGVLNMHKSWVAQIVNALYTLTEPVLDVIRRVVKPVGGLDLSPVVLLFALYFVQNLLWQLLIRL